MKIEANELQIPSQSRRSVRTTSPISLCPMHQRNLHMRHILAQRRVQECSMRGQQEVDEFWDEAYVSASIGRRLGESKGLYKCQRYQLLGEAIVVLADGWTGRLCVLTPLNTIERKKNSKGRQEENQPRSTVSLLLHSQWIILHGTAELGDKSHSVAAATRQAQAIKYHVTQINSTDSSQRTWKCALFTLAAGPWYMYKGISS